MEKIVKNVPYRRTKCSSKLRKLEHTTYIVKKSNQYQTNNLDIKSYSHRSFFDAFVYSWYFIIFLTFCFFKINVSLTTCFHDWRIPWKYENCRLHYQNPRNGNNVFKSHSQVIESKKCYEILTIYEWVDDYKL